MIINERHKIDFELLKPYTVKEVRNKLKENLVNFMKIQEIIKIIKIIIINLMIVYLYLMTMIY